MIIPGRDPVLKRLPVSIDHTEGIQRYDRDNRYPQRAKESMYRSYTLSGIIPKLAGFLNGEGFVDPALNDLVVSDLTRIPLTAQMLLDKICKDRAWINGFALHVNFNANFKVSSVMPIPFEYCRMEAIEQDDDDVRCIKYCTNWEQDYGKENWAKVIIEYDRFNPDHAFLQEAFTKCGGPFNYKGQIFYWTPEENQYPKATFDAVFELAQAQYEISEFTLRNVVNGFTAGHIFLYPGKFEDDKEREDFKYRFREHKGAMGANSTMIIEAGTTEFKGSDLMYPTTIANNDRLFEFTSNQIEKAILQNYGMPYEIIGKMPDSGLFNKQQIEDAYTYYNAVTRDMRNEISRALSYLFRYFWQPIASDFAIQPQKYDTGGGAAIGAPGAAPAQPETAPATNSVLTNLTGRQNITFQRYLRDFANGRNNYQMTKTLLQSAFGFSDDEIVTILGEPNPAPDA
jgi:hypothetical protein